MICHDQDLLHSRVRRQITPRSGNKPVVGSCRVETPPRRDRYHCRQDRLISIIGPDSRMAANHPVKTTEARPTLRGRALAGRGSRLIHARQPSIPTRHFRSSSRCRSGCDIKTRGFAGQDRGRPSGGSHGGAKTLAGLPGRPALNVPARIAALIPAVRAGSALCAPWLGSKTRQITRVGFGGREVQVAMFARAQSKTDQGFNEFDAS
jgi:hypothetical protein